MWSAGFPSCGMLPALSWPAPHAKVRGCLFACRTKTDQRGEGWQVGKQLSAVDTQPLWFAAVDTAKGALPQMLPTAEHRR